MRRGGGNAGDEGGKSEGIKVRERGRRRKEEKKERVALEFMKVSAPQTEKDDSHVLTSVASGLWPPKQRL